MKTISLTIDLKSFCLGALVVGAMLLMANKPTDQAQSSVQPQPYEDSRRYQVVGVNDYAIIMDTKTGRFLYENPASVRTRWQKGDFEQLIRQQTK